MAICVANLACYAADYADDLVLNGIIAGADAFSGDVTSMITHPAHEAEATAQYGSEESWEPLTPAIPDKEYLKKEIGQAPKRNVKLS